MTGPSLHPDPWRDVDAQPNAAQLATTLELRGGTRAQTRLRRRFLRFVPVRPGDAVLEVGCGTGVVLRDLAAMVGRRGRVVGVDSSVAILSVARKLCRRVQGGPPITLRRADGARLPFGAGRFDAALAITVILHVADPLTVVSEMARVVRRGGTVGLQDQDFGVVAVTHPDRELTDRIMRGVAARVYAEPYSGRRLPGLLRATGLEHVRLLTDVYQDTTLEPFTKTFLERRAENAVKFGLVDAPTAQRWLDGLTALVARGAFVLTMNYYGAVGAKP
ncbi:MAG: methyltransferase domain-containing protein [Candidatus Rokubacteria bacterium]|nr:methyltransferase domain-containing protein [Candidatus Rokubacteria bacterium]